MCGSVGVVQVRDGRQNGHKLVACRRLLELLFVAAASAALGVGRRRLALLVWPRQPLVQRACKNGVHCRRRLLAALNAYELMLTVVVVVEIVQFLTTNLLLLLLLWRRPIYLDVGRATGQRRLEPRAAAQLFQFFARRQGGLLLACKHHGRATFQRAIRWHEGVSV